MVGIQITQIGVVVKDLKKTMENYYDVLGWGPWRVYELRNPRHHNTKLRGEDVKYSSRIAETTVGNIDFELIEPLDGPSIYKEHLEEYGEGLHHIACMGTGLNYEKTLEKFEKSGFTKTMSGSIDSIDYYYLNTEAKLKIILESGSGHASSLKPDWIFPKEMDDNKQKITVTQIGVVVKDIRESLKNYTELLGWGPWNVYELEKSRLDHTEVYGEVTEYTSIIAETNLGNIDFELIEPVSGPNIYKEYIEQHGEGLHHLACMGSDSDHEEIFRKFRDKGFKKTMTGRIDGKIEYYYLDTDSKLKVIFESGSGHARSLTPSWVYPDDK